MKEFKNQPVKISYGDSNKPTHYVKDNHYGFYLVMSIILIMASFILAVGLGIVTLETVQAILY